MGSIFSPPSVPQQAPAPAPVPVAAPVAIPKGDEAGKKRDQQNARAQAVQTGRTASFLGNEAFGTGTIG